MFIMFKITKSDIWRHDMDKNLLKYMAFVKAVECASFTKAAELLNYSQSGISRMINDLEKEWGISLLERGKSGVRLTGEGSRLLPHAKAVVNEYEKLQMTVDSLNGLQSGIIRIGTFSSVASHWLPKIIKDFRKDYPGIDYELLLGDYTEIEDWISSGRIDFGFLRLPTLPQFDTIVLGHDELVAVIPENHPLANCDTFPVKALCDEPFLLLEKGENGAKAEILKIFEENNLSPQIKLTILDDYAIMSMVESGLGISILSQLIMKRIPYRIVAKPLDVRAFRTIGIALKDKKTASLAVKRFLEYMNISI